MNRYTMTTLLASAIAIALLNAFTGTEAMPNNAIQIGALAGSVI